jgi:DNA-binding ferritin-like protein (Dps family)
MSDAEENGLIATMIGPKKRWRAYKARVRQLPEDYQLAVDAIERFLMLFVPTDRDSAESRFEDLVELFEQAAADGTPIREVVGNDPVEFVRIFAANYSDGGYVTPRARKRLVRDVARAAGDGTREDKGTV